MQNSTVNDELSDNVKLVAHFFETDNSGESLGSQKVGVKSEGGTANSPGPKYAQDSKKTELHNYRAVDKAMNHGKIASKTLPTINEMIQRVLKGEKFEDIIKNSK